MKVCWSVDPNGLNGKVMFGYQGWFGTDKDGLPGLFLKDRWKVKFFRSKVMAIDIGLRIVVNLDRVPVRISFILSIILEDENF